ncbi:MAG: hypothetical protein SVU88_00760 [Candidatus Nanohaloarchaea archaeon]|nr:hypothetical protein [Candidatus Nanohaloarchaea archaeon]
MRTGQYTLVEQVVLFALGISITLGFLFAFRGLGADVQQDMQTVQSELVAEYMASNAVELVESGADGRMEVPLPERIASSAYALRFGEGGVMVAVNGEQAVAPLYGLSSRLAVDGDIGSDGGAASLERDGHRLTLARPQ